MSRAGGRQLCMGSPKLGFALATFKCTFVPCVLKSWLQLDVTLIFVFNCVGKYKLYENVFIVIGSKRD